MSFTLSVKSWLNLSESNESLMLKYGMTSEAKYLQALVNRLGDDLYHYLLSQSNPDIANDISQITWEKVINNRRSFSETGTFKSWLFKIARFALIDEFRRHQRWSYVELEEQADDADSLQLQMHQQQTKLMFDDALMKLPFLQREAFILQQEGMRLREISIITGTEMETVKSRLRFAKSNLKHLLQLAGEGER